VLTLIASILLSVFFGFLARILFDFGPILVGLFALIGFLIAMIPLNLWIRKKMEKIFTSVQQMLEQDQTKIRRQMNNLQARMQGSPKGLQKQIEKQQTSSIHKALKELDKMHYIHKWNLLAKKQENTLRGQLLFQAKEFGEADKYLASSLNSDPTTVAMKMARFYQKGEIDKAEKLYKKVKRKFKGDKGILIHCLYAWILVKQNRTEEAFNFLTELKEKTENTVVHANWEHLANGRVKNFSNAGLGETWYALHLEQPRASRVKQRGGKRRR